MKQRAKKYLSLLMIVFMIMSTMNIQAFATEGVLANHVVINQIYGSGGNSGAVYNADFVELYNPTDSDINLTGWSVQYASSTGAFTNICELSGTIKAKDYYLVVMAPGANGVAIPNSNQTGALNFSGSNGKVALATKATSISGKTDDAVIDFVGYGSSASEYEGVAPAPAPSSTESIIRSTDGVDTNSNSVDFTKIAANPRAGAVPPPTVCATPIASIPSGVVLPNTVVTFSTSTTGADVVYNTFSAESAEWTTGSVITITADTNVYVKAVKEDLGDSLVNIFNYTVDSSEPLTIAAAKAVPLTTENVKVKGVVSYINNKNVYIQDNTGAICLYLTANSSSLHVGDEIVALGKRENYNSLVELTGVMENKIAVLSTSNEVPDRGTATIAEIIATPDGLTAGYDHMCEIIKIEGATLTDLSTLTQESANITISPSIVESNFPGITIGDTVDVVVRVFDQGGTTKVEVVSMSKTGAANNLYLALSNGSADVVSGATITVTCNEEAAAIYYTLDGSEPTELSTLYNGGIHITGEIGDVITLKVIAKLEGKVDSEVVSATYKIKDPSEARTIKDVLSLASGTADVEVKGTLVYFATSYSNPVIQSEIDGEMYSLYVYGSAPEGANIGDVVKFKGTYTIYGGLPEMTSILSSEILSNGTPIPPQEITISELKENGLTMLGRYVKVKDVTLGATSKNNTEITDSTGTMNIYKATSFPVQVVQGDVVDLYAMVGCYNTTVQLYTGLKETNGYNVYDVVNDIKGPVVTLKESYLPAKVGQDYTVALSVEDNKGVDNVKISYTIGDATVSNQMMTYVAENNEYQFVIPAVEVIAEADTIDFTVTATDVTGLTTTTNAKSILIDSKPQFISVSPARNGSTGEDKAPMISVEIQNAGENPVVKLTVSSEDSVIINDQVMNVVVQDSKYAYPMPTSVDGKYSATVTVTRADSLTATTTWSFTVGTPTIKAFFGQLHAHTAQYSDGSGTLADGLSYLKNLPSSENVDFVAFTDHSNYFDTQSAANPADAMNDKTLMTAQSLEKWNTYVSDMATFNEENAGSKLAFPGYEMTWSGGPGHINTFNSVGLVSRNNSTLNNKTADAGMKAYYDTLIKNSDPLANLSQFNHPGSTFGTFSDFAYWSASCDNKMVAVEVGNGEGAIGSGGYFPSFTEYTKALDKGWHVAPTNNQDNHKGKWGNANNARTVIISDDLSTTGLLNGLKNMSVYATEDKNLNISYTINDLMMGSIISEVPNTPLQVMVTVDDPDSNDVISKVEIITNSGRVAASKTFETNAVEWNFELPSVQGYYYVRVTQADKNIAVTAPVWVGQAPLVGISSLEASTKMPVTNEALNFTTTLFNNEASNVTLKSLEYTVNGQLIKKADLNESIVPTGTYKHSQEYMPTTAGDNNVVVTAEFLVGDQTKIFTQEIKINVRNAEKLVYIGIDASHYNEYVNGNYKDSMGNFANMAVEYDVRVVELKTSEEFMAATSNPKFKMLILTPPTRRNGSSFKIGYMNYTEDELEAIKSFAEAGNTIIITGWGDYYESYTKYSDGNEYTLPAADQMSAQQNRVLESIGSSLRISDDEAKDDVTNGGQPQRLYLTNYNTNNPFISRVITEEQVYSSYGGSTIYAVDSAKMPTETLSENISPMVYSFTTSYSSDDDKDGTTGIPEVAVPKYSDKYLIAASETVNYENGNTSTIIVAGAVFMSNFEIQVTMDSYATPAYSNYTIMEDIVKFVNPVVISNISDVQSANEGERFTVRGIVTSNASGYDKDTAFFDCIYVQDGTAGINAFPVAGDIRAGQLVEITGKTSSYNGERQIAVEKISIIDSSISPLPTPYLLTTAQAAASSHLGSLVKVSGKIVNLEYSNNVIESIYVKDDSGVTCRVFIDGYITSSKTIDNLQVGANLTAVGLSSFDTEGARIRVRDRSDIICTAASNPGLPGEEPTPVDPKPTTVTVVEATQGQKVITGSIQVGETQTQNGQTVATVSKETLNEAIDQLTQNNTNGSKNVIEVKIDTTSDADKLTVTFDKDALSRVSNEANADMKITSGLGTLLFDQKALSAIGSSSNNEEISISINKVDTNDLSDAVKEIVKDRPVFDFSVTSGTQTISDFGNGSVKVSLPYTLQLGEKKNAIVVYYLNDKGELETIRGNYNEETHMVEFKTKHFSTYMLGYKDKSFNDVKSGAWYYDAVSYIASRQIANGTSELEFSPDAEITRGQFLVMLMNAYNVKVDTTLKDNFADAGNSYYTAYLATAKKLGLASGTGDNKFKPDAALTREDMMTLLYNALSIVGELPEGSSEASFEQFGDHAKVSSYAQNAVKLFVEGGFVSGKSGNLDPKGNATRAQMAQILYNLLMIK